MPHVFSAPYILPIASPPIRDGFVAIHAGRIVAAGSDARSFPHVPIHELTRSVILPGLVNAHAHLELSWMAGRVQPASAMPIWLSRLLALRRSVDRDPIEPIADAIRQMRASGTALVGDVTNTLASYDSLVDSDLSAAIFHEVLGFNTPEPEQIVTNAAARLATLMPVAWLRPSLVPHAPYSVSPALFRAIAQTSNGRPLSVHVGESMEERQFLHDGTGAWRDLLQEFNAWTDEWQPPGCGPVEYLERLGLVNERLIAVHAVQLTDEELRVLAAANATVVTCPRSNRWVGVGSPPVERFYASGVRVAIGTDSLASVEDLQMFNEMAAVRALAPDVPAARVLASATRHGADALGFGDELGTIEPGKHAALIAVTIPHDVEDVEEYLVSGRVQPADVRWLPAESEVVPSEQEIGTE